MATTGYSSTGAFFDSGYGLIRIHGDIVYNVSRTNNTVYFTGTYARIKYVRESGSVASFSYGPGWNWRLYVTSGSQRREDSRSGSRNVNDVDNGGSVSFSFSVGVNDTSVSARVGAWFSGDGQTYANKTLSIPSVGSPSGQSVSVSNIKATQAQLNASISNWGSNATAGSGQRIEYREAGGSWINLAYSTSTSHNRTVTGLKPSTTYEVRTYALNGAGKSGNSSTITFKTKPAAGFLSFFAPKFFNGEE